MVATPLTPAQVQALYPSSSATGQADLKKWEQLKQQKGARRTVEGTRTATTKY